MGHKNVSEIKCSETPHSNMIEVLLASTENSLLREENTGNNIFQCETYSWILYFFFTTYSIEYKSISLLRDLIITKDVFVYKYYGFPMKYACCVIHSCRRMLLLRFDLLVGSC